MQRDIASRLTEHSVEFDESSAEYDASVFPDSNRKRPEFIRETRDQIGSTSSYNLGNKIYTEAMSIGNRLAGIVRHNE